MRADALFTPRGRGVLRPWVAALVLVLAGCTAPRLALQYADRPIDGLRVASCQTVVAVQCGDAPNIEPPVEKIVGRSPIMLRVLGPADFDERVVAISAGPWTERLLLRRTSEDRFQLAASPVPYYVTVAVSGRGWSSVYMFGLLVSNGAP